MSVSDAAISVVFFLTLLVLLLWYIKPPKASAQELETTRIHPDVPSLFKTFENKKIHYHQLGQGPDLVLLHGIGASTFIFRELIPLLRPHFRLTVIDMPGFGRSAKPRDFRFDIDTMSNFVVRFLESVGVRKFGLVGSSMGGSIGLWISKLHGDRCHEILTIAPSTHGSLVRYPPFMLKAMAPLHHLVNIYTMAIAIENVVRDKRLITRELLEGYLLPYRDRGAAWRSFLKATDIIKEHRMPAELSELNVREEFRHKILWGDDDRVVPLAIMQELVRVLTRSEFVILPRLGHHPFEEDPRGVARHALEFFRPPTEYKP